MEIKYCPICGATGEMLDYWPSWVRCKKCEANLDRYIEDYQIERKPDKVLEENENKSADTWRRKIAEEIGKELEEAGRKAARVFAKIEMIETLECLALAGAFERHKTEKEREAEEAYEFLRAFARGEETDKTKTGGFWVQRDEEEKEVKPK